jgi:hypothetical protein
MMLSVDENFELPEVRKPNASQLAFKPFEALCI